MEKFFTGLGYRLAGTYLYVAVRDGILKKCRCYMVLDKKSEHVFWFPE